MESNDTSMSLKKQFVMFRSGFVSRILCFCVGYRDFYVAQMGKRLSSPLFVRAVAVLL